MSQSPAASPRRSRGFMLLIAASLVTGLVALVLGLNNMVAPMSRGNQAQTDKMLAEQLAALGIQRAVSEIRPYFAANPNRFDFDGILKPAMVGRDSMPTWAGSVVDVPTASGRNFVRVDVDINGDGSVDGAYLVRYDDNMDDSTAIDYSATTTKPPEGTNTDEPLYDRDQSIFITSIGIVRDSRAGAFDYDHAKARLALRATVQTAGVPAVWSGGNFADENSGDHLKVCGTGAAFCGADVTALRDLKCFCGTLRVTSKAAAGGIEIGNPRLCDHADDGCARCDPQDIVEGDCTPPVLPTQQAGDTPVLAAHMNNLRSNSDSICYFRVDAAKPWYDSVAAGGPALAAPVTTVHLWDPTQAGCNATSPSATMSGAVAQPDFNPKAGATDCWVPVFVSAPTAQVTKNLDAVPAGASFNWVPGTAANIPVLDSATAATAWAGPRANLFAGGVNAQTYAAKCGITPGSIILDGTGTQLRLTDGAKGFFYFGPGMSVSVRANGGSNPKVAIAAEGNITLADNNWKLTNPLGVIPGGVAAMSDGATIYALATASNCNILGDDVTLDHGINCKGGILWDSQHGAIRGNVWTQGDFLADHADALDVCAGDPKGGFIGCPTITGEAGKCAPALGGGGLADIHAKNCTFRKGGNGAVCANMYCDGNLITRNDMKVYGTLQATGTIKTGNNNTANPIQAAVVNNIINLQGARPRLAGIQVIPVPKAGAYAP